MTLQIINENEYVEEIGFTVDYGFLVLVSSNQSIGKIYVNRMMDDHLFIEWVEIFPTYQNKGFLRKILRCIMEYFHSDVLYLESSEKNNPIYYHLGAEKISYDEDREMTMFQIFKKE